MDPLGVTLARAAQKLQILMHEVFELLQEFLNITDKLEPSTHPSLSRLRPIMLKQVANFRRILNRLKKYQNYRFALENREFFSVPCIVDYGVCEFDVAHLCFFTKSLHSQVRALDVMKNKVLPFWRAAAASKSGGTHDDARQVTS